LRQPKLRRSELRSRWLFLAADTRKRILEAEIRAIAAEQKVERRSLAATKNAEDRIRTIP
jgi:hypothetical protein